MRTAWGDLAVADAHVHFFSRHFFELLAAQLPAGASAEGITGTLGWDPPPAEPERLAERWVVELNHHGVASAAIIASLPGDEDSVAAAVRAFPQYFHGYFMLNPTAPGAVAAVQKALNAGLKGICLFPAMHRYSIKDERVQPIFELAAAQPGALVFVHAGVLTVGVRKKLGLPSQFDMSFSNPIDLHAAALRFPRLPFVIPHFGAGYFREALMLCDLCPNVCLDTSSSNSWMRYSGDDLAGVFRRALDVAGPARLLFGTDSSFFPRGWHKAIFDQQAEVLRAIGLSAADAALIFGDNLRRLLSREFIGAF